jgi:glycosyltransferase involved in cell wall biosynthesis
VKAGESAAVSVTVATYNSLGYLRDAVASVLAQTFFSWELIIVDDGSSDGTRKWLESLMDPRIKCIYQPHTGNLPRLRNLGIDASSAPWIAFLDADDVWLPKKLERHLAFHREHPAIRWSYSGRELMDAAGQRLPDENYKPWVPVGGWIVPQILNHDAMIATPATVIHRSLLAEVGGLEERFGHASDYWLRLVCAQRAECGVIDEALTRIREHAGSTSYLNPQAVTDLADAYRAFRTHTNSEQERALCRKQEAFYRAKAARLWTDRRAWREAARSAGLLLRLKPFHPTSYRISVRWLLALLRLRQRSVANA